MKNFVYALLICAFFGATAVSATLNVPGTYATIQDAINSASNGDTVLVDPGTYVENINYLGKAITVQSTGGASATVIDGNSSGVVVTFATGEGVSSILDGFTITNGIYGHGAGIQCNNTSPTILNNTITANTGAAGLGISCISGSPVIRGNTITGNNAMVIGGGIYCENADALIDGNFIHNNSAGAAGGGINCTGGSAYISNNVIYENSSNIHGGGIHCDSSTPDIVNNTIWGNDADANGGGINCQDASPNIMNNTIYENTALSHGGGIGCDGTSSAVVTNTILWNDFAPFGAEIWVNYSTATITVTYSDVMLGFTGEGNLNEDPRFQDAANRDFHLTWLSPCINRGTNKDAPSDDMDGDARPCQGTVDMGADEYSGVHALEANSFAISQATGGAVDMNLEAGVTNGNRNYFIFGSVSGTVPGIPLPKDLAILPLNYDVFTNLVISLANTPAMANFHGILDGAGAAASQLNTSGPLPSSAIGLTMYFAYLLYYPYDFVSNPIAIEIVP